MKRKLLVCVMALATAFVVTGCDKKENNNGGETTTAAAQDVKLACEASMDGDSVKITLTYDNDAIKTATFTETEKYDSEKEAKSEYEDSRDEFNNELKNKGMTGSMSYSGTLVTRSVTFKVAELDDKSKELYDSIFEELAGKNYNEAKAYMESVAYTCK